MSCLVACVVACWLGLAGPGMASTWSVQRKPLYSRTHPTPRRYEPKRTSQRLVRVPNGIRRGRDLATPSDAASNPSQPLAVRLSAPSAHATSRGRGPRSTVSGGRAGA